MSARSPIRAFIVDDEALARAVIRLRLADASDIEVVGEATDGPDAVRQITELNPDLVFLDIQMPEMDGFEVLDRVAETHLPIVVFVTAHDQYALRAFEAHALDYLLKPFTTSRFESALNRARVEVARAGDEQSQLRVLSLLTERLRVREQLPSAARDAVPYLTRLTARYDSRVVFVKVDDIDWLESAANYVRIHVGARSFVVRMTMQELERQLDPSRFARIHRSSIVQIDRIEDMTPAWHGDFDLRLKNGTVLRLTRSYRARLMV